MCSNSQPLTKPQPELLRINQLSFDFKDEIYPDYNVLRWLLSQP